MSLGKQRNREVITYFCTAYSYRAATSFQHNVKRIAVDRTSTASQMQSISGGGSSPKTIPDPALSIGTMVTLSRRSWFARSNCRVAPPGVKDSYRCSARGAPQWTGSTGEYGLQYSILLPYCRPQATKYSLYHSSFNHRQMRQPVHYCRGS